MNPTPNTYSSVNELVDALGSPELKAQYHALKNREPDLLIDIRGGPGTGKSSMALVIIRRLVPLLADCGAYLDVRDESEDDVLGTIGESWFTRLSHALAGKRVMIKTTQVKPPTTWTPYPRAEVLQRMAEDAEIARTARRLEADQGESNDSTWVVQTADRLLRESDPERLQNLLRIVFSDYAGFSRLEHLRFELRTRRNAVGICLDELEDDPTL